MDKVKSIGVFYFLFFIFAFFQLLNEDFYSKPKENK